MAAKRKSDGASDSKSKKAKPFSKPKPEEPSALPEPLEAADDEAPATDAPAEKTPKKEKKEKKEKKDKKESGSKKRKADDIELTNGDDNEATDAKVSKNEGAADVKAPKAKKSKKAKKAAAEGDEAAAEGAEGAEVAEGGKKEKANRFIVFVGNLPYTANAATIRQHFASVKPEGVRCLTKDGKENTCRGFAFIEFTNPTNMRTCLDKLHHSIFNDGLSPARKINVELTVGGGGNKSTNRKEKIKARNAELEVNRAKRIQKEAEQKRAAAGGEPAKPSDDGGMHPSRRAMLP